MNDIVLESCRALVLIVLIGFLWRSGQTRIGPARQGWFLIITGFALLLFASLLDITDNYPSLNRFVIIGDTQVEAFLEKLVGYLGGFVVLAIGLVRWIPTVQSVSHENARHAELEKSLKESEAKLKLAAQTARLGYWHFDEVNNEYLDISEEYARIFGYTVEEFMERFQSLENDMELVHPDDREAVLESYQKNFTKEIVYRIFRRDGSIAHVREINADIFDQTGTVIEAVGTLQDITEHQQREITLIETMSRAEKANKAKSEFLSSMSHELRTPMNAILGFAELLGVMNKEPPLSEKQKAYVDHILQSGHYLMDLIDQVLELSKIEAGKLSINFGQVKLDDIVDESLQLIRIRAQEEGIEIIDKMPRGELPLLWTDSIRLTQALLNLLSNAVKYNRSQGSVTLSYEKISEQTLRIKVTDTGMGIPAEMQQKLFQPFERLGHETGDIEGTGIGLTVTRQVIDLLGGEVGFQSEEGKGSTFWIDIPKSQKPIT